MIPFDMWPKISTRFIPCVNKVENRNIRIYCSAVQCFTVYLEQFSICNVRRKCIIAYVKDPSSIPYS